MSVPVLSQLFGACRRTTGTSPAAPAAALHRPALGVPTPAAGTSPAARASSPRAARLPEAARQAQPLEPILLPRLRICFADFPYLHCSIDQRLFTLETCCGYRYDQARESLRRSLGFSRAVDSAPDATSSVALGRVVEPISGQPDSRLETRREEKTTLPGTAAGVSEFARVAAIGRGRLRAPVREC